MRALMAVAAAAWVALAGPAGAKIVTLNMTGTILSKSAGLGGYLDSPLAVGDPITATIKFEDDARKSRDGFTYFTMGAYGGGLLAQAGPYSWTGSGDYDDGADYDLFYGVNYNGFHYTPMALEWGVPKPIVVFDHGNLRGIETTTDNAGPDAPEFSAYGFQFDLAEISYDITYMGPSFHGIFTSAAFDSVPTIPEPSTWAMLILGFGFVGAGLRRQRARSPAEAYGAQVPPR